MGIPGPEILSRRGYSLSSIPCLSATPSGSSAKNSNKVLTQNKSRQASRFRCQAPQGVTPLHAV
jgi:hypothetical protein